MRCWMLKAESYAKLFPVGGVTVQIALFGSSNELSYG